jgi:hypothetical protein
MWARLVAIVGFTLLTGGTITYLLYQEVVLTEFRLSCESFKGALTSVLATFDDLMTDNLRGIRGVGDALSAQGTQLPLPQEIERVRFL